METRTVANLLAAILVVVGVVAPCSADQAADAFDEPAARAVLESLSSSENHERVEAARRLSALAVELWTLDFDDVMPSILQALDDPEVEVRQMAAVSIFQATWVVWGDLEVPLPKEAVLAGSSPKLRQIYPELIRRLDDPDPVVREYLFRALGTWMPEVPEGLTEVAVRSIDDPSPAIARLALSLLGRMGDPTSRVVDQLVATIESRPELRATAVTVLADLYRGGPGGETDAGNVPDKVIAVLIDAAGDPEETVRLAVIQALARLGPASEAARTRLQLTADDRFEGPRVRAAARAGLAALRSRPDS